VRLRLADPSAVGSKAQKAVRSPRSRDGTNPPSIVSQSVLVELVQARHGARQPQWQRVVEAKEDDDTVVHEAIARFKRRSEVGLDLVLGACFGAGEG
jgi:hypothetical protein